MGTAITTNRVESIADISLTASNTTYTLPTSGGQIPNDRWLAGLILTFEGRMTNPGSGNPTAALADAPYSLFQNITIGGYHKVRSAQEDFINVRGADLRVLDYLYKGVAPLSTPATLSVAASATNDIRFQIYVPFTPAHLNLSQSASFLLDAPNYDRLQLKIQFSDALSVFSGQSTQPTFTAYGSTTGSPRIRVSGVFAQGGQNQFRGLVPARVWRYGLETVSGDIVSGATQSRLFNLPRGYKIRGILMKTGTKATVTGGNDAYSALTDAALSNIQVNRGLNRYIRRYLDSYQIQERNRAQLKIAPIAGYSLIDFVGHNHPAEVLDTSGWISGAQGDTDFYLSADVAAAAAQGCYLTIEEWRGKLLQNM